ncbi:MAG: hypothetical protein ACLSFV_21695 [Bacteroides xylanisolvens]
MPNPLDLRDSPELIAEYPGKSHSQAEAYGPKSNRNPGSPVFRKWEVYLGSQLTALIDRNSP